MKKYAVLTDSTIGTLQNGIFSVYNEIIFKII
jgi:hypothetical protein